MFKIDLRDQVVESGYIKKPGSKLKVIKHKLNTNHEYVIITCNDLELISEYINQSEKRVYILLDKNVTPDAKFDESSNVWFVKTDMELPNLISTPDMLLSLSLSQFEKDNKTILNIFYFLKQQLLKYIEKYTNLEVSTDFIYIENENVLRSNISDLSIADKMFPEAYDLVVSDDNDLIPKYKTTQNSELRSFIEIHYDDYAWIVKDNKVNLVIKENKDAYILTTNFSFDVNAYERYDFFEKIRYIDLKEQDAYTKNFEEITIAESVSRSIDIYVDLLVKNDQDKLDKVIKAEISKINTNGIMAFEIEVMVVVHDLKLSDMKDTKSYKQLSREDNIDMYLNLEENDNLYSNGRENIVVVKKFLPKYNDMDFLYVIRDK